MSKERYIEDIREIKDIMSRKTRFISLSGLSGISTGIIAIAGSFLAYQFIFKDRDYLIYNAVDLDSTSLRTLLLISVGTVLLSIGSALFFTSRKTKREHQPVWDMQTKNLLINMMIPLITGGILCLMLVIQGFLGMLPPLTLIFYGLALVNASKYTLTEIRYLGLIEIVLGLLAFHFIEYGLVFWAFGFGVIQIVYGLIIQRKY